MRIVGAGERIEKLVLYVAIYWGQSPLSVISHLMHLCWLFIFCLKLQQAVSRVGGSLGSVESKTKISTPIPPSLSFSIIPSRTLNNQ